MSTYLVGYDLDQPGQDYSDLHAAIKALGAWWHHLDSTWLVKSDLTHTGVRDKLRPHIDANDKLLVMNVTADAAAWYGFNESGSQWLRDNL
jgi:hypothetical protein